MEKEMKVAVLIDAENISSKYIEVILREANALGNVIYKRIYGNWTTPGMGSWRDVILDNSIQPIQQYNNTAGKNSSDSSLIIDAMDLLYQGRVNGFCIVSSDSDFTRLAARLRESEMFVQGMGEQKTPRSFISACNKFSYLDLLYADWVNTNDEENRKYANYLDTDHLDLESGLNEPPKKNTRKKSAGNGGKTNAPTEEKAGSSLNLVKQALRRLTEENSDDDGWIFSGKLGALLGRELPDFDVRNFGYKKFFPFIESLGIFQIRRDEVDGKLVYFRLR